MSLKLLKLHWKIFFWSMTGRINKLCTRLEIKLDKWNKEKVLIIFPMDEPNYRVAMYAFRNLGKGERGKQFIFIIKEQFKTLSHLQQGEKIFIHDSDNSDMLSDEKFILHSLDEKQFDIIIDLNPVFHLGVARLISMLSANMKIGFISQFSDRFYNIQLDISKSGIMERGFQQINLILAQ